MAAEGTAAAAAAAAARARPEEEGGDEHPLLRGRVLSLWAYGLSFFAAWGTTFCAAVLPWYRAANGAAIFWDEVEPDEPTLAAPLVAALLVAAALALSAFLAATRRSPRESPPRALLYAPAALLVGAWVAALYALVDVSVRTSDVANDADRDVATGAGYRLAALLMGVLVAAIAALVAAAVRVAPNLIELWAAPALLWHARAAADAQPQQPPRVELASRPPLPPGPPPPPPPPRQQQQGDEAGDTIELLVEGGAGDKAFQRAALAHLFSQTLLLLVTLLALVLPPALANRCAPVTASDLVAAPGLRVELWADGLRGASGIAAAPDGLAFVSAPSEGAVYAVDPRGLAGGARRVVRVMEGLQQPLGVDLAPDGSLYVAAADRVWRLRDAADGARTGVGRAPEDVYAFATHEQRRGLKYLRVARGGDLLVSVPLPCNLCTREAPLASVLRLLAASNFSVALPEARGVRASRGFDVDNGTGFLWLGDAGRSFLGAHAPPDELNVAVAAGLDFGAPHCFGANEPDPSNPADCTGLAAPARLLAPHASPGGMRFYTPLADAAARLPTAYLGGLVFTERGSEGRRGVVGARLAFARLSAGRAAVEEVATAVAGFRGRGHLWPCAVPEDVAVAADGALLVTESRAGVVYRVSRA